MNEHSAVLHAHIERRDLFHKRRWRSTRFRNVLISVPGTSDATVENFAFAERAVLVLAYVRHGGNFAVVFEDGDAFSGQTDDSGTTLRDVGDSAGVDETFLRSSRGNEALTFREA